MRISREAPPLQRAAKLICTSCLPMYSLDGFEGWFHNIERDLIAPGVFICPSAEARARLRRQNF
jgi:hypothetical protein